MGVTRSGASFQGKNADQSKQKSQDVAKILGIKKNIESYVAKTKGSNDPDVIKRRDRLEKAVKQPDFDPSEYDNDLRRMDTREDEGELVTEEPSQDKADGNEESEHREEAVNAEAANTSSEAANTNAEAANTNAEAADAKAVKSEEFANREEVEGSDGNHDPIMNTKYGPPLVVGLSARIRGEFKTIGWTGKTRKMYLNQYGPDKKAVFRLEDFCADEYVPTEEENISDPNNRIGERKEKNQYLYGKGDFAGIYGVAFQGLHPGNPQVDDLALIDPEEERERWTRTYLITLWHVGGGTWSVETRTTMRRIYSHHADLMILQAAAKSEQNRTGKWNRYLSPDTPSPLATRIRENGTTKRSSTRPRATRPRGDTPVSRSTASPTPGRGDTPGSQSIPSLTPPRGDTPVSQSTASAPGSPKLPPAPPDISEFREKYCMMFGVGDVNQLDPKQQATLMKVWMELTA